MATATRQESIEQMREIMAKHRADRAGNCARCLVVMPVAYPNTPRTFPCGPYQFAAEMVARLGGTVSR